MRAIAGLLFLGLIAVAFFVWRAIVRSPKLDKLFAFEKREETARDILDRRSSVDQALVARGRTLSRRKTGILKELDKLNQQ